MAHRCVHKDDVKMKFYIIRHGVTEWNTQFRIQGAADVPLAPEGIRLAAKTGEALKDIPFDICFTSPLIRAKQTAQLILGERINKIPIMEDERIQEINFGVLEGVKCKDDNGTFLLKEFAEFFRCPEKFERPENGENIVDICRRTKEFWNEKIADPHLQDKTILIASHGCAVRALLQNVYEDPKEFWHGCVPPNCAVNVVEVRDKKAILLEEDKVYAE